MLNYIDMLEEIKNSIDKEIREIEKNDVNFIENAKRQSLIDCYYSVERSLENIEKIFENYKNEKTLSLKIEP